jgi:23S rRNA-/tRNA-specific pseudouridylate synthase
MQYIKTPIVGDILYGGGKSPLGRLCLHAKQLEITIPSSTGGKRVTFEAELPDDFAKLVNEATQ